MEAHTLGFYDELRGGLASMLHTSLKTSNDLQYAMLIGIQRVAKENIFSDLNNPLVCTVKDREYAEYFGFTKQEVKELLEAYGFVYDDAVRQMYDGYNMGGIDIYNLWSLLIMSIVGAIPLLGEYQFKQNDKISDAGLRGIFQRWI
ncbi:MAG: AAA family ATPase [[Clostridium] innocuum]